jgi:hypothetical protein
MKPDRPQDISQPFLLRVWKEELQGGGAAWCGRLQHIVRGDARLFRSWEGLIDLLESSLRELASEERPGEDEDEDKSSK